MNEESSGGRGEEGFLSLASLFAVLGLVIGFALLANVGKTIGRKLETQNAADAAATGAGIELARGMNAVTAANHLIGELHALVVLHHALGGDPIDGLEPAKKTPQEVQDQLKISHELAERLSQMAGCAKPIGYDTVKPDQKNLGEGAAIYDSRLELKKVMTKAYYVHAAGAGLQLLRGVPFVGPALYALGVIMVAAALIVEAKVVQEWIVLDAVSKLASLTSGPKQLIQNKVIPAIYGYTRTIPLFAARSAEQAAFKLGEYHQAEASLFPGLTKNTSYPLLTLPIEPERTNLRNLGRSQLVRASTPWIQQWRKPWLTFGTAVLTLSGFSGHYRKHTNEFTIEMTRRAKKRPLPIDLLIMKDTDPDDASKDKGREPWTQERGSERADALFGTMAFAHRPATGIAAFGYYRQPNPDGFLTFAQVMIYNGNPQKPGESRSGYQKRVGWDTLNWSNDVPEYPGPGGYGAPDPRIKLNWQAKLVPTTRLAQAKPWQREPSVRAILDRTPANLPGLTNTH